MTENPPPLERSNNFDALRLVGAVLVLVGHGFVLHGMPGEVPTVFGIALHPLGVAIFFSISGFLIMGSWLRRPRLAPYLTNRAARILPALAASTLACAFILGPIVSTLPPGEYFGDVRTWAYLANLVPVLPQYDLPGVFASVPYPDVANGSLWTLRVEFACYAGVLLLGLVPRVPRIAMLTAAGVAFAAISQLELTFQEANVSASAGVITYFIAGAILRQLSPKVLSARVALIAIVPWIVVTFVAPAHAELISFLILPYVLISLGSAATPIVRRASRYGDFSYGMYLWAFPTQQTLLYVAPELPLPISIVICLVISTALAIVSWHLVEKVALVNKDRLPWMRRQLGTVQV